MKLLTIYKKLILFAGFLLCSFYGFSAEQERYLHFTEVDGLPRNITTCLEQDQYGYLWIGTTNGIARFDGKSFYCFNELSGLSVTYLLYSSKQILWAATNSGLYRYNRLTNFFELVFKGYTTKVQEYKGEIYFIMNSTIYKVVGDKVVEVFKGSELSDFCFTSEGMWLGKSNDGVALLSQASGYSKIVASYLRNKPIVLINKIDGKLFAGCYNGELYTIVEDGKVLKIDINNHYFFKKILKIKQEFWLATDGYGIIVLDKNLHLSRILSRSRKSGASINSNSVYDILEGNNHEIWIASWGAGLTCILPDNLLFQNILPEKGNENSLVANEGISVFVRNPYVYFGTNYGLSEWNESTSQFKNTSSDKLIGEVKGSKVSAILYDTNSHLWIGTYDGLLGKYTPDFKLLKTYHPISDNPNAMQQIIFLREISKNTLLILSQFPNRILVNFDTDTETASDFKLRYEGYDYTYYLLNCIREDRHGDLMALVTDKGLFHVNWKDNMLENKLPALNKRIDTNITDFYQDKKGHYWFATAQSGLLRVSEDGKSYKKYTIKEGLPSNTLVRIESVDDRFLWISTISGICRFDTENEEALNFNLSDGLPANEFLERVSAKTFDGRIIFGSTAGFTIVNPSKVNINELKTEVIISDVMFQSQSIRNPKGKQLLTKPLEDTKEIWLPYTKNSFSIYFFARNKSFLKYHNYAYRLSGLEKEWTYVEANHASYTNLFPGTYTFEIKTADKTQGGAVTQLIVHIRSPWYLSWYSYIIYAIILITILYLSTYAYLKRMALKKEKEISEFMIQKEHELTEKKLEFFTNVSHDLKTPLTLIDAPVNDLLQSQNLNQEQVNKLLIINRNSKRLYKLITDLLDFRKITQKQYVLEVSETVISDFVTDIVKAFKEECKHKSIKLKCTVDEDLTGFVDARKIEKILWNLLSNALKFTNKGGSIYLNTDEIVIGGSKYIKFLVSDSGIGISKDDKDKIFERFYKAQDSKLVNKEGTGIGLSIVKELVDIHHGTIQVKSELGEGTAFTVVLPSDKKCYTEDELVLAEKQEYQIDEYKNADSLPNFGQSVVKKQYNIPGLLIVEDNAELREYLAGHFEKKYKIYVAADGLIGLKLAKEVYPDIILTDVEMPNMNGYGFCKEIRKNFDSSHIPIIMLTANNTIEHQIEGLSNGADVYLTKPFDINLLDAQINSLLENRKALRKKFLGVEPAENIEKALPQKDIDFILELRLFIEENMINQDLSVELLSEHFAVSLAQLHRKIKSLTGTTPNNLIKSIRLKRAYKFISEEGLRVSEAAYQTGFSDPNYFTICFKKEFGENPSQIAASIKDSDKKVIAGATQQNQTIISSNNIHSNPPNNTALLPLLLVAEDNEELQNYMHGEFKTQFRVISALDGTTAYEHAVNDIPDIIISDIVMPGMDGFELCSKLKTDERTSHIPIILLTAKNTEKDTLEGLETGADDYIPKPFNIAILKARVKNLLHSRLLLRSKFMKEPEASVKEISPSKPDERFLKKAYEIVEKYIENPDFDVQLFSSELGMSRAQLYRKIDAVSGQSVHEFIRIVRLKKAAELLSSSNVPVSEILSKVGFNSFAYFTKSFREYFGVTPSQYKR